MAKTATVETTVNLDSLAHQLSYLDKETLLDFVQTLDLHVSDTAFSVKLVDIIAAELARDGTHVDTPALSVKYPNHRLLMTTQGKRIWRGRNEMYTATEVGDEEPSMNGGYVYLNQLLRHLDI